MRRYCDKVGIPVWMARMEANADIEHALYIWSLEATRDNLNSKRNSTA